MKPQAFHAPPAPLPRECSTTELPQLSPRQFQIRRGRMSHRPGFEARGPLGLPQYQDAVIRTLKQGAAGENSGALAECSAAW
jgi:hypothetical protein